MKLSNDSNPLPNADLARLEALAAEATPGPWAVIAAQYDELGVPRAAPSVSGPEHFQYNSNDDNWIVSEASTHGNAEFIAAARTAIPALVREVREGRKARADIAVTVREMRAAFGRVKPCPNFCAGQFTEAWDSLMDYWQEAIDE